MSPEASREQWPERPLPVAKSLDPVVPPAVLTRDAHRTAAQVPPDVVGQADEAGFTRWTFRETAGFLVSLVVHVALLVALSLLVIVGPSAGEFTLVVNTDPSGGLGDADIEALQPSLAGTGEATDSAVLMSGEVGPTFSLPAVRAISEPTQATPASGPTSDVPSASLVLRSPGGGFEGRRGDGKAKLLGRGDATPASENAVGLALAWLAAHQWRDGGWRLDLTQGPCGGQCRNSGSYGTTTGATGLALLPFLGAGQTHMEGEYRDVVHAGLYYLKDRIVPTPHGADLREGTMYAQGIATIALCEAYGMTKDETLRQPAQQAINFICWAQHSAGGWRYYPGEPGDTTVLGWQMMALKSASMAGLDVPSPVVPLAERFLDSVQSNRGAFYGYITRAKSPGPTAIGLLIRMYTGWDHYDPRLKQGVLFLAAEGPSKTDMYFNYYATQVMHHYGGPEWLDWNQPMREGLVRSQAREGHEQGSWHFNDPHGERAGRLYTTAMCAMILEVYYRHMPLYESTAVDDGL